MSTKEPRVTTGIPTLDMVLGGGVPVGKFLLINQPPLEPHGKSVLWWHIARERRMIGLRLNDNPEKLKVGDKVRTDFEGRWDRVHTIEDIDEFPTHCQSGRKVLLSGIANTEMDDRCWLDAAWAVPVEDED